VGLPTPLIALTEDGSMRAKQYALCSWHPLQ
jgi:hypothetical protein